jgi:anti-sigma regulatory factor (Ser/Thr protein kinase)
VSARLRIELPARPEEVPSARGAITRLCEHLELEEELAGQIRLAVTEACANCVLHAYDASGAAGELPASTFALEARVDDDALVVVVRDAGAGISRCRSARAGLGLGLRLIRQAASSVDITSRPGRGTRVAMRFALR